MTKAFSLTFKRKMVERLTGKNALNPSQLARETGIRQQNLCRWLEEARSLPLVASHKSIRSEWTVAGADLTPVLYGCDVRRVACR